MNCFSWPGQQLAQQLNCQKIPTSKGVGYNKYSMIDISKLGKCFLCYDM